ncbi:YceI family protein [Paracoccus aestuariivivens]|uniref:Lipid/polyisoprenoid-binding YceI-like domain-containing protein n=1 Tax=Paracoccus aestuariivivens TaxID=1820333 RepID=A0A6L6JF59_9RHOB|nr:YceI family protein [Paracoccus aestuariivivens]MTH79885.1 hypothetical protein [Paracoccus aestuariivivens]
MLRIIRVLLLVLTSVLTTGAALAATRVYQLDGMGSRVGFSTESGAGRVTGNIPVTEARLRLDFGNVSNSSISVMLDASAATANTPFAAEAMRGPTMLDTAHHPTMVFRSTRISSSGNVVKVVGDLTIRGVSRPVTLQGSIARMNKSDANDLDRLQVRLSGAIRRSAYGATGWSDAVSDVVRLVIVAQISRVEGN